jgi:hypothetical protein
MEAQQQDFNARVNLLVPSKVWYFHDIKDNGLHDVNGPRLGNDLQSLSLHLSQVLVRPEHDIGLAAPYIIVTDP